MESLNFDLWNAYCIGRSGGMGRACRMAACRPLALQCVPVSHTANRQARVLSVEESSKQPTKNTLSYLRHVPLAHCPHEQHARRHHLLLLLLLLLRRGHGPSLSTRPAHASSCVRRGKERVWRIGSAACLNPNPIPLVPSCRLGRNTTRRSSIKRASRAAARFSCASIRPRSTLELMAPINTPPERLRRCISRLKPQICCSFNPRFDQKVARRRVARRSPGLARRLHQPYTPNPPGHPKHKATKVVAAEE